MKRRPWFKWIALVLGIAGFFAILIGLISAAFIRDEGELVPWADWLVLCGAAACAFCVITAG